MKKKNIISKNYLEKIPSRPDSIEWKKNDEGIVTLEIKNTGLANKIAQVLFKKPKVSYIHLDKMGSFIWPLMDGKMDITEIGKLVDEKFGKRETVPKTILLSFSLKNSSVCCLDSLLFAISSVILSLFIIL